MVIDFHTHAFPDELAKKAIPKLAANGNIANVGDGTVRSLLTEMGRSGVDRAVILNIATNAKQQTNVNNFAIATKNTYPRLYTLGSIHPDSENIESEAKRMKEAGIRGIKIHPDYISTFIDDPKMDRVYAACVANDLFVASHSGWDFVSPDVIHCTPERIVNVLDRFPTLRFVAVHMGANTLWDDTERLLIGRKNLWIDTSLASPFKLDKKQAERMLLGHDPDHILFGSDFPWFSEKDSLDYLDSLNIPESLKKKIRGENALALMD